MNDLFPFELERELVVIKSPKVKPDALTSPEMAGFILVTRVQEVAPARLHAPEVTRAYWDANIATLPYFDPDREFFFAFVVDTKFNVKGVRLYHAERSTNRWRTLAKSSVPRLRWQGMPSFSRIIIRQEIRRLAQRIER